VLKLDKILPTALQDYVLLNLNKYERLLIRWILIYQSEIYKTKITDNIF
jgi:hypothetical protein